MKLRLKHFMATLGLGFALGVQAAPVIELKDGSRIQGEIQSLQNGQYTIVSSSLGTLHVAQSAVAHIAYDGAAASLDRAAGSTNQLSMLAQQQAQQVQTQLAQDPDAMSSVMALQEDPQIQALLNDPQIMQAIASGDYDSLLNNPKIQALDNNAQLKKVLRQFQ